MRRLGRTRPEGRVRGWANLRSETGEDILVGCGDRVGRFGWWWLCGVGGVEGCCCWVSRCVLLASVEVVWTLEQPGEEMNMRLKMRNESHTGEKERNGELATPVYTSFISFNSKSLSSAITPSRCLGIADTPRATAY